MDSRSDKELGRHIEQVFDNFEAPSGDADAGWNALREKFPVRKQRPIALWWSSAAAILLFIGLGIWLLYQPQPTGQPIVKKSKMNGKGTTGKDTGSVAAKPQNEQVPAFATIPHYKVPVYVPVKIPVITYTEPLLISLTDTGLKSTPETNTILASATTAFAAKDSGIVAPYAGEKSVETATETNQSSNQPVHAESGMAAVFARKQALAKQNVAVNKENPSQDKRLVLSVYAGTFLNYAKGSRNEINAGAGLNSDIRLLKKVKLVTGLAIAQNRLRYDSEPVQSNVYASALAAASNNNGLSDLAVTAFFAGINERTTPTTQLKGYSANFTGLDIPVNIKYEFGTGKSENYVLAGVSSGTFINETYQYNYSSSLLPSATQTAETRARFSTFDFARTLNIAIGIGTPVGKGNSLIIEPFLKYPLSGLGSQQISFGASGLNLKFKFSSRKK